MALINDKLAQWAPEKQKRFCPRLDGVLAAPVEPVIRGMVLMLHENASFVLARDGKVEEVCAVPGDYRYESCTPGSIIGVVLDEASEALMNRKNPMLDPYAAGAARQVVFMNRLSAAMCMETQKEIPLHVIDTDLYLDYDAGVRVKAEWSLLVADPVLFYDTFREQLNAPFGAEQLKPKLQAIFNRSMEKAMAVVGAANVSPKDFTPLYGRLAAALTSCADPYLEELGLAAENARILEFVLNEKDMAALGELMEKHQKIQDMESRISEMCRRGTVKTESEVAVQDALAMLETMPNWSPFRESAPAAPDPKPDPAPSLHGFADFSQPPHFGETAEEGPDTALPQIPARFAGLEKKQRWFCSCGTEVAGNFCPDCGEPRPKTVQGKWICSCGSENERRFCGDCGTAYETLWD